VTIPPGQGHPDGPAAVATRAVHVPIPVDVVGVPVSVPIYQTTVFAHEDPDVVTASLNDPRGAYGYSRMGNPTVRALEQHIAALEGAVGAVATSSGMGAIATALGAVLTAGSHLVVQRSIYGGTTGLLKDLVGRWNVTITEVAGDDPAGLAAALRTETAVVYLETASNPMTDIADITGMSAVAREHGALTVVDNTFASPVLCRPLALGADVVVHSATKYLGGHSDVTAGVVAYADEGHFRAGWSHAVVHGVTPDPFGAWLVLRGSQTLPLRIRAAGANAATLAQRLADHPAVAAAHHPSLPGHPQHALAAHQLDGPLAILSFDLAGGRDAARALLSRLRLIAQATSLGGVETLAMHPASTSHRLFSPEELAAAGVGIGTVRISCGIEDVEDLWADLAAALSTLPVSSGPSGSGSFGSAS
jgi:cystathionine beta-lyase/cystathionine gamma-synthase